MKNKILPFLSILALMISSSISLDYKLVKADVSTTLVNSFQTENVALGKSGWVTYSNNERVPSNQIHDLHTGELCDTSGLTDGDVLPGLGHKILTVYDSSGAYQNVFVCLDLEREYTITSFDLKFWNNHHFSQIVIQVANNSDFSDCITVFNNDTGNAMGQGYGTAYDYVDAPNDLQNIPIYSVRGRYVRVSGRSANDGRVFFGEIGVNGVTGGLSPVSTSLGLEKQKSGETLSLTAPQGSKIYYTLDGTYPSILSNEYKASISLDEIAKPKVIVRAIAVDSNNNTSIVSNFKYDVVQESVNVALGKTLQIPSDKLINGNVPTWQGNPSQSSATDGSEDPFNTLGVDGTCWATIDFGKVYSINKVKAKFWHDWAFAAVIQLSTTADFSEGNYTVFSNYGKGLDIWDGIDEVPMTAVEWYLGYREFKFQPVEARYMRIYNCSVQNETHFSCFEEIQAWTAIDDGSKPSENIAFGKDFQVPADKLVEGKIPVFQGSPSQGSVTDGSEDPFNTLGFIGATWTKIDFGDVYPINKVKAKFWHDWEFQAVIQLSTKEDFSENVYTVYSNYGKGGGWDSEMGITGDFPKTDDDWYVGMKEFTFDSINARYMRVINREVRNGDNWSLFEELQAWTEEIGPIEEDYPIVIRPIIRATEIVDLEVPYSTSKEEVIASLPTMVKVYDDTNYSENIFGSWECDNYNGRESNEYVFTFTPSSSSFVDTFNIMKSKVNVLAKADKTELQNLVNEAKNLDSSKYLTESWSLFSTTYELCNDIYEKEAVIQNEVDGAVIKLKKAIKDLVLKGDKTKLNELISLSEDIDQTKYTQESYNLFKKSLDSAKDITNQEDASQTVVNQAYNSLLDAKEALELLGINDDLISRYNELKDTNNIYTNASYLNFAEQLDDAKKVIDKINATENEINFALDELNLAYELLVVKADFSNLQKELDSAKKIILSNYTSTTQNALKEKIAEVNKVLNDDESTQELIDSATIDLKACVDGLVAIGNKTELTYKILNFNYEASKYTISSYNDLLEAKDNANLVLENKDASQVEVDKATNLLDEAINNLKEKADLTELNNLIKECMNINETDYTVSTYTILDEALEYGKSVILSNDVSQEDADEAISFINKAKDNLQLVNQESHSKGCKGSIGSMIPLLLIPVYFIYKKKERARKEKAYEYEKNI